MLMQVNVLALISYEGCGIVCQSDTHLGNACPCWTVVLPIWEVAAVCSQPHLGLEVGLMKLGVSNHYVVTISFDH